MSSPKFIQIACTSKNLYALDEEGRVWRYVPQVKPEDVRALPAGAKARFAFWTRLTAHRAEVR